jgi:DNA-binding IclR family transcriptional regulator
MTAYAVGSVDAALKLLLLLDARGRVRVSDAAAFLGVAPSTAHRLLGTLREHGFVEQDGGSREYLLGPTIVRLGLSALSRVNIRDVARPHIERLSEETGETIHIGVLRGPKVLFVDSVESSRALRVSSRLGALMWAHCTSLGKAMLAQLPPRELRQLFPQEALPTLTQRSTSTRTRLTTELRAVRARGYAVNRGEGEDGVGSVGVAIHDGQGRPVAAICAAAPLPRLGKERLTELATLTCAAARAIGAAVPPAV